MYAVVTSGGKQYRVKEGDVIRVEKLEGEVGQEVEFPVLMLREGEELKVGNPYLEGVKVVGRIARQGRGEKIIIFKYKRRKNYRRKLGHRQYYTWVKIEGIQEVKENGA
ncbi:MAG TPA: 50S ribosomal protein L21 [Deltaproteobacteria bacterium]|nr:50S ribosomal protein L21 [Deltaproteobacteria bacterium]